MQLLTHPKTDINFSNPLIHPGTWDVIFGSSLTISQLPIRQAYVRTFLSREPQLEFSDSSGRNFFHALYSSKEKLVVGKKRENLLAKLTKQILAQEDTQGNTPAHYATQYGYVKDVYFMICLDPRILWKQNKSGKNIFQMNSDRISLQKMFDRIVDKAIADRNKILMRVLLLWFTQHNVITHSKKLIDMGADIHVVQLNGEGLLHMAVVVGSQIAANYLVIKGIDINITDEQGDTPLHFAVRRGNVPMVDCLLKLKANFNQMNHSGESPLSIACGKQKKEFSPTYQEIITLFEKDSNCPIQ